jgi:ubiquinone/menaquinone biosynthesis C-methylase UbiE
MNNIVGTGFEDVDRTSDPAARVSYLDAVAVLNAVRAYKRQMFELMQIHAGDTVLDVGCG